MKQLIKVLIVFLILPFTFNECFTQNKKDFDPYFDKTFEINPPNGPFTITRNLIQDRKGDIWFATFGGIIRYDGKVFTNHTNKDNLRPYRAFSVLEDRNGDIWFGMIGAGVYRYDGKSFENITTEDGLAHNSIGCIYEDNAGNIWFGTMGGISIYDGKSFKNYTTKDGLTNDEVNYIAEAQDGTFWIGTRGEACTFDGETFKLITSEDGSSFVNVRCIIADQKGSIWLGGNNGLWRYHNDIFSVYGTSFVGHIYEDKNGSIWTSSELKNNRGTWVLTKFDELFLTMLPSFSNEVYVEEGMFFGILEDKNGKIWWGTLEGVYCYDGNTFNNFKKQGD